jgi:anti-sigma regulatory factor (Ser/Thr protein kinase)
MSAAATLEQGRVLARQSFHPDFCVLSEIRAFAEKWGREVGLDEEQRYSMKLAASEACANAIEHPKDTSDLTLCAWDRGDRFTLDVWHAGRFMVKAGDCRHHRGMGLPLMLASVDEVIFTSLPKGGTRVSLSMFLRRAKGVCGS